MILTPMPNVEVEKLAQAKGFFLDIGFRTVRITTPKEHDEMISFTSQLAHIVSSAYIKNPNSARHKGFSAGSFQDMTRVARLNENMWTELFLDDADYLSKELDILIHHLSEYSEALKNRDAEQLRALLKDGREKKATAGGN
jgi:prephenate dehydrogenase